MATLDGGIGVIEDRSRRGPAGRLDQSRQDQAGPGRRREVARGLPSPAGLRALEPPGDEIEVAEAGRRAIANALDGHTERLLVIVGPCSIHDATEGLAYARMLAAARHEYRHLLLVMRAMVEKPRTRLGWPGLVADPGLDGSGQIAWGLQVARRLLRQIVALGMPVGCEWVNPLTAAYLGELVSWSAIGARTVESPLHRQLASGLPGPVGMKNTRDGDIQPALDAIAVATQPHTYLGTNQAGEPAALTTRGNPWAHLVLRGGTGATNYDPDAVADAYRRLEAAKLPPRIVIDASHGNSGHNEYEQLRVIDRVARLLAVTDYPARGVMIESSLVGGRQDLTAARTTGQPLRAGQSITDACLSWSHTLTALDRLDQAAQAAQARALRGTAAPATAPRFL
jgi:3-deoxy-7-phosphoheptulonate synthase